MPVSRSLQVFFPFGDTFGPAVCPQTFSSTQNSYFAMASTEVLFVRLSGRTRYFDEYGRHLALHPVNVFGQCLMKRPSGATKFAHRKDAPFQRSQFHFHRQSPARLAATRLVKGSPHAAFCCFPTWPGTASVVKAVSQHCENVLHRPFFRIVSFGHLSACCNQY